MADSWAVPAVGESKSDVVAALYRAMTDPRAMRDLWQQFTPSERALAAFLADVADQERPPTVADLAGVLDATVEEARAVAARLYRLGVLAREGDDDPLPVGEEPRLLMPREVALNARRVQDEIAAGDLAASPLRVLIELMDDAELETTARAWGSPVLPGVASRAEVASRILRSVADPRRVARVVNRRSPDAAAIWHELQRVPEPQPLGDILERVGLAGSHSQPVARRRAALAELESALLVWHTYHRDGSRWLFIPHEIREPGRPEAHALPPLTSAAGEEPRWRPPFALAWDLLTILRIVSGPQAPPWHRNEPAPRWLRRVAAPLLWHGQRDDLPTGYLDLLQALGLEEGIFQADESAQPVRIVPGPNARAARQLAFPDLQERLRGRWLRLPAWVEGEAAGIVDVRGADWRGMRPRLLAALRQAEQESPAGEWVTLESLALWVAAVQPGLVGPSFRAATARMAGEVIGDISPEEARAEALADIVAFECAGPCAWFGLVDIADSPGTPRAVRLKVSAGMGAHPALVSERGLEVLDSGEIVLHGPTPERVWALSAFAELVELGPTTRYRLTSQSVAAALTTGVRQDHISGYLERSGGVSLPLAVAASLTEWVQRLRVVRLEAATVLDLDDRMARDQLGRLLRREAWEVSDLGERQLLVRGSAGVAHEAHALRQAIERAGFMPRAAAGEEAGVLQVGNEGDPE
ncbi:MAG: helicase-associated domain-containing protein [Thermomicrobiales bacterium]